MRQAPYPCSGREYWAKLAAGKKVGRTHFRAVADPAVNRIVIYGGPELNMPEVVKAAKKAAKKREQRPENKVEVIAVPEDLHPKVARTGKTHVALGLGLAACQKGLSVGFITAAALVHELMEARDDRQLLRFQKRLAGLKLLVIDELGFLQDRRRAAVLGLLTTLRAWRNSRHFQPALR